MLMAVLGVLPSVAGSSLLIHLTDGTEITCSLAREPQMLFGEKAITLTALTGEVGEWNFSDVESWEFSDQPDQDEIDAIDKVKSAKPQIKIEDGRVIIQNTKSKEQNSQVTVYDTNGQLMFNVQCSTPKGSRANGENKVAMFNVNKLVKGTYLLKVGESCVKFSVR